jgi:metallo-beta-lactamase class B
VPKRQRCGKPDYEPYTIFIHWTVMGFPPCKVGRILRDGDTIKMGEVQLTAHPTPGHTRGATTWVAKIVDNGGALTVVWPDGGGFNAGYRVASP